jgi:hypothetical protein
MTTPLDSSSPAADYVPPPTNPSDTPQYSIIDPYIVVSEYYSDVSAQDYLDASNLFARVMQATQGSYARFVAGYSRTGSQEVTEISETGDQVNYYLESINPDGTDRW